MNILATGSNGQLGSEIRDLEANFILNIFLRAIPRLLPKILLKKLYRTFLRN